MCFLTILWIKFIDTTKFYLVLSALCDNGYLIVTLAHEEVSPSSNTEVNEEDQLTVGNA